MTCAECGKTALEQCWICGVPVCGNCDAAHRCKLEELKDAKGN